MKKIFIIALIAIGCQDQPKEKETETKTETMKTIGSIEKLDPALDAIVSADVKPEIIAEGFDWSEGPLWIEKHKMLIFSDVPMNTIYKWTEEKGKEVYLTPSGYTDTAKRGGEMGSNGLTTDNEGNLVLCQHGNRQMARSHNFSSRLRHRRQSRTIILSSFPHLIKSAVTPRQTPSCPRPRRRRICPGAAGWERR